MWNLPFSPCVVCFDCCSCLCHHLKEMWLFLGGVLLGKPGHSGVLLGASC